VRKVVFVQSPDGVLGNRQGLVIGCERATLVHRTDLDSDPLCIHRIEDCLNRFEEESRPVFQAPAVFVFAEVGRRIEELRDQVKVIGEYLNAIEAGFHRVSRSSRGRLP